MPPRGAGPSAPIPSSFTSTSSTRAGTLLPGNSQNCSARRCVRRSVRCANRSETSQPPPIGARVLQRPRKHMMNRPERAFETQQIRVERRLPSYWGGTFDLPPVNIFGPKEMPPLNEIIPPIQKNRQGNGVLLPTPPPPLLSPPPPFSAP